MKIGVPKEIKNNENRIAMTPYGVADLVRLGHTVYIQSGAGSQSGFADQNYVQVGGSILPSIEDVYAASDMIVKVKEPIEQEFSLVRPGQIVFTYFHFAAYEELTTAMMNAGAICIAYETVEKADHSLPLLLPMSEVAGRAAVQAGARALERPCGGKGVLLGGVPGVKPGRVLVLGGGIVGMSAAMTAAGMGADVTICDISIPRMRYLSEILPSNVKTLLSSEYNIRCELPKVDLVIGAVLIPGAKAPKLLTRSMLSLMEPGSVVVDVAIDQGGCFETSRPTSHSNPTYVVDGVVHYCVANIPGAFPRTSTLALTNATLPYIVLLAMKGWKQACREHGDLKKGLNVVGKQVVHPGVARAWNLPYTDVETVLN
ncbi:MAG: alanine dehydrogenase [Planctomycetia bacterium]|nr:alanine dehydrogenase [Planctomycetia bacterium]